MADFRLLTYDDGGTPRAGLLAGDRVHDLRTALEASGRPGAIDADSVLSVLQSWETARPAIDRAVAALEPGDGRPLTETVLRAPILYPGTLFFAGATYRDHMMEMNELVKKVTGRGWPEEPQAEPWFVLNSSAYSVIGSGEAIRLPRFSEKVDWEAEIGLVIGREAKDVPAERAMDYVAGFLIVNDVSLRDYTVREESPMIFDWFAQKCFDTSAPMGPWITPTDAVADPGDMDIKLWVNDELMQDSNSCNILFSFGELIAYLARRLTLRPGDVIATGCPSGVGMSRGRFLRPGDEVRISVGGLGELRNPCVAG